MADLTGYALLKSTIRQKIRQMDAMQSKTCKTCKTCKIVSKTMQYKVKWQVKPNTRHFVLYKVAPLMYIKIFSSIHLLIRLKVFFNNVKI